MATYKGENHPNVNGTERFRKQKEAIQPRLGSTLVVQLRIECHLNPWPASYTIDFSGQYFLSCHEG